MLVAAFCPAARVSGTSPQCHVCISHRTVMRVRFAERNLGISLERNDGSLHRDSVCRIHHQSSQQPARQCQRRFATFRGSRASRFR